MIYFDIRITEIQNKYLEWTKGHSKLMNHVSIDFWCISWLKKREKYTPRKILHTHILNDTIIVPIEKIWNAILQKINLLQKKSA